MDAGAAGRSAQTARNRPLIASAQNDRPEISLNMLLIANAPRKPRADAGEASGPKRLSDANHHFAIGLVRFKSTELFKDDCSHTNIPF
jgi:hypothetical protein